MRPRINELQVNIALKTNGAEIEPERPGMSLILAARYREGILLAADPFFFDNVGELPTKGLHFGKFAISTKHGCAMVGVGSSWVLSQAAKWLNGQKKAKIGVIIPALGKRWARLNTQWRKNRQAIIDQSNGEETLLRPLSESLLVIASQEQLDAINIINHEGTARQTRLYVLAGSGAGFVRAQLRNAPQAYSSNFTIQECLAFARHCYTVAGRDLYVAGIPSFALVNTSGITDFSSLCQASWEKLPNQYWREVCEEIINS